MAERTQKSKQAPRTDDATIETGAETAAPTSESGEKLKAELDDLLDEIDGVLETNAEEFVHGFVQKGGQ